MEAELCRPECLPMTYRRNQFKLLLPIELQNNKQRLQECLVPGGGVEPPRPEGRRILSPLRLPVPPSRLFGNCLISQSN